MSSPEETVMNLRPILPCVALLALPLLPVRPATAATQDRIFANGFDPCCRIGGTVSGLTGTGLVLHLAAGSTAEDKPIAANGVYDFAASVAPGTAYTLSAKSQPSGQTCTLSIGSGTMGSADIGNANVACANVSKLMWDSGTWGQNWN
jgi:hypothetical protein